MTAMAGSSRTLYQGSRDGWLPKYLGHVNATAPPPSAMWTDFGFNVFLSGAGLGPWAGYFYVLGHLERRLHPVQLPEPERRLDSPHRFGHMARPWKAPPG
jgi:hypothetical protein